MKIILAEGGVRVKKKVFYLCSLKSTSSFHIITATQTKPMPKRMKKVVSDISYSSSSFGVSFCLNENHIDNPIATNPITNNVSVNTIRKSTNNYPTKNDQCITSAFSKLSYS